MKHPKRSEYDRLTTQSLALLTRVNNLHKRQQALYPQILDESLSNLDELLDSCLNKFTLRKLEDLKLEAQILAGFVTDRSDWPDVFIKKMRKLCRKFTREYEGLFTSAGDAGRALVMHTGGSFTAISKAIDA